MLTWLPIRIKRMTSVYCYKRCSVRPFSMCGIIGKKKKDKRKKKEEKYLAYSGLVVWELKAVGSLHSFWISRAAVVWQPGTDAIMSLMFHRDHECMQVVIVCHRCKGCVTGSAARSPYAGIKSLALWIFVGMTRNVRSGICGRRPLIRNSTLWMLAKYFLPKHNLWCPLSRHSSFAQRHLRNVCLS